jgi:hypothetical protein
MIKRLTTNRTLPSDWTLIECFVSTKSNGYWYLRNSLVIQTITLGYNMIRPDKIPANTDSTERDFGSGLVVVGRPSAVEDVVCPHL